MGFFVLIEGTYDTLRNRHPEGKPSGGNAILAFLTGLAVYQDYFASKEGNSDVSINQSVNETMRWYQSVETNFHISFFPDCQALIGSIWGDGGKSIECYSENDYEFYANPLTSSGAITREQFRELLQASRLCWKPITDVINGVRLLLDVFNDLNSTSFEGFYEPMDTIPDFEALLGPYARSRKGQALDLQEIRYVT